MEGKAAAEPLKRRDRVGLWEDRRGISEMTNVGTVVRCSTNGYLHVEWDDHSEGWFSPAKAAALLRRAEGDDALPRHVWTHRDVPLCVVCLVEQTDDNEFGPCKKAAV